MLTIKNYRNCSHFNFCNKHEIFMFFYGWQAGRKKSLNLLLNWHYLSASFSLSLSFDDETKEANVAIHLCNLLAHSHLLCFFMTPFSATSSFFNTQQQNILQSFPPLGVSLSENHTKREKGHKNCCNFTFCCPFLWRNRNGRINGTYYS